MDGRAGSRRPTTGREAGAVARSPGGAQTGGAGALHAGIARFRSAEPESITVTAPTGSSSQAQGTSLPVTWTTNAAVSGGEFSL